MKIGLADYCPKKFRKTLMRQEAEINFLKEFLKKFETIRPHRRLPEDSDKEKLLRFLEKSFGLSLEKKLKLISVRKSRFYKWKNLQATGQCLRDKMSCPRLRPTQLTLAEVNDIRELVSCDDLTDMSLSSLYWHGRREGKVKCSISTWFKYIAKYKMIDNLSPRRWSRAPE